MSNIFSNLFRGKPVVPDADTAQPSRPNRIDPVAGCDTAKLLFWRMARRLDAPVGHPLDQHADPGRNAMVETCRRCSDKALCQAWLTQNHPPGFPVFCPNAPDLIDRATKRKA